ncbi:MAG: transketolase [Pseudogulbenkiania sp.]|nr:transketolase [Pseudogulbenkiania sp.]
MQENISTQLAKRIRLTALELCYHKKASHLGGAYSIADILAVLYAHHMRIDPEQPDDPARDRLFYSKGHACTALYAVLQESGFFDGLDLHEDFTTNGSYFTSHVNHQLPGIELSTGSLGHALGVACGVALAAKRKSRGYRSYVIASDGELDEGSNWEAILFAPHHALDNLVLVIDYNKLQSFGRTDDVLRLDPLGDKFKAFGWHTIEIDGHDHALIDAAFREAKQTSGRPTAIIAHTVKGKGVSFMEDTLAWHYKSPNDAEYAQAKAELEAAV